MKKNILMITGEPSGDIHAGKLLKELVRELPDASFWGIGGDNLQREGLELVEHIRDLSIVGIVEIIKKLPKIHAQFSRITSEIEKRKPDLAILVDYPGFNLKVAEFLKKKGIPVVYYIIPQIWAWGPWRINKLKKFTDKTLVLFDFEETLLRDNGLDCEFVGHPLVDSYYQFREDLAASGKAPVRQQDKLNIALLPGSRNNEIDTLLPIMLDAAQEIYTARKDVNFLVAESSNIQKEKYTDKYALHSGLPVTTVTDDTKFTLENCDFALVTSGTATLETAMMEKPMIITYKTNLLTYILGRKVFMIVDHLGLANIIAGKEIVPELLQYEATGENMARTALDILASPSRTKETKAALRGVRESLGARGASRRAAEAITRFLSQ